MKTFLLFLLCVWNIKIAHAQLDTELHAEQFDEKVDSASVPSMVRSVMRNLVHDPSEIVWHRQNLDGAMAQLYKADFWQQNREGFIITTPDGDVIQIQRLLALAEVAKPTQQVISKKAESLKRDFKRTTLDIIESRFLGKIVYEIICYIPMDGTNWTPFDTLYLDDKGKKVKPE